MNKICYIGNFASHYRQSIFNLMDKELKCDFIFGAHVGDIKKMDYSVLCHFKREVENLVLVKNLFYFQRGVIKELFNYDILIMVGEPYCISTWIILLLAKIFHKQVYLWSHGWYGHENCLKSFIKRIFFRLCSGVFLYGQYAKHLMIGQGFNSKKLFVIYNSLSFDEQVKIREAVTDSLIYRSYFNNENKNIIFVGRLTKVKRLDLLISAIANLKVKGLYYNVIFIGDGQMREELKSYCSQLSLNCQVWFYGACYDEKVLANLIYNADLCVSPGNVGLTAIHSLTYGTPVITHNNFSYQMPEFEAIRDGITGSFFEYNDVDSLAKTIENWLESPRDRNSVRNACFEEISSKWNPHLQILVLMKTILGREKP